MKGGDLETGTQTTEFLQPGKVTIFLFTECFETTLPKIRSSKNQQHCVVSVDDADSGPQAVELLLPRPYTIQKTQLPVMHFETSFKIGPHSLTAT